MTLSYEVGYNRRSTPYKQYALDEALGHLLGSSVSVAKKINGPCFVCDMTAGPGLDPTGHEGSPLILARHITRFIAGGHDVRLVCVERGKMHLDCLQLALAERYPDLPVEYFTDQATALASIPKNAVGLTYWDPTRYNDLDTDLLAQFGRSHKLMDILITRECLAGYRMQHAAHCPGTLTIQDYLALTGKKCNYIRQYAKHGWWTFGFADNWEGRPARKMGGLVNVQSKEGERMYRKWTMGMEPDPNASTEQTLRQGEFTWAS